MSQSKNQNIHGASNASQHISEDTLRMLLQNEAAKLEHRRQQIELQNKALDRQHEYAMASLVAQKEHLRRSPKEQHLDKVTSAAIVFILLIVVMLFFVYLLQKGHSEVVFTILKYMGIALISFFGGSEYAKNKMKKDVVKGNENIETVEADEI